MDFSSEDSQWSFQRSKESEHFILFWEADFGADTNSRQLPEAMRVDSDKLLENAERCYATNTASLGFGPEKGKKSYLKEYKMMIFLHYQEEWLAAGSGYDDVIGALWINPAACRSGSTIAHEIGHCFQYQVYCDHLLNGGEEDMGSGFRYSYDNGFGNTFWEQSAQWQAYQDYPEEAFNWYDMEEWAEHCNLSFEHEWVRYQSYWLFYALQQRHGQDTVSRIWKNSRLPEDALGTYLRLYCNDEVEKLNEFLYYYASHAATYDFDGVRAYADEWIGSYVPVFYQTDENVWQISYHDCPEEGGYNVVPLPIEEDQTEISVTLESLSPGTRLAEGDPGIYMVGEDGQLVGGNAADYNSHISGAEEFASGHRFGFVALTQRGERIYSEMYTQGTAVFSIPDNTSRLFLTVVGAAPQYSVHIWDEDESTDHKLPYRISFGADE
ncbi:MAG: DUF6055 domain-containing protein [Firmicutes bacterium]|nr:DUF6055 domain-containing protein [Bacillota bacterium]